MLKAQIPKGDIWMKEFRLIFSKGMVCWFILIAMTLLPSMGLSFETSSEWSSQYKQALQLLQKSQKGTERQSIHSPASRDNYLLKKIKYYRLLDTYIKDRRAELSAEGLSISVISKNDLLFLKGYGLADKDTNTHVTPLTLFGIGSVTKVFTGIAIMQLVEQGKIDLDAPLENYIPGFGFKTHYPGASPITVRSLMTHQSGLVGDILKGSSSVAKPQHNIRDLVDYFNNEYLAYRPGYISTYSNSAVALLGIVIEEVSGIEYKSYVKKNICEPIGMILSDFALPDYMRLFLSKTYDSEGVESPFIYLRDEPSGSFISNTIEMSLFMRMILNGGRLFGQQILKQSSLEQMFIIQNNHIELDFPQEHGDKWGLSWQLYYPKLFYAGKYAGHDGGIGNYFTQMHILPEHELAVIVETNSESPLSSDVADMAMIKALEIFKGIKQPDSSPLPPIVPLSQNHILQTSGNYATNHLGLLSIYPNNHRLVAVSSVLGDTELELMPHADNWYSLYLDNQPAPGFDNLRITVKNGEYERFVGIQHHSTDGVIFSEPEGSEYEIPEKLSPEWANRVGFYRITNPDADITGDPLILIHLLSPSVMSFTVDSSSAVLDPIYNDEAIRTGRGRNINETIQVVDCNGEECLYWLGYLLKKQSILSPLTSSQKSFSPNDLILKGREIEEELIRGNRSPGL
jgi:CubicO group peptidase (beta-lactamase class C family)